ncbi:MAG: hypothetical protein KIS97_03425 [Nitrospira sp.]|nr:hypothetical protein [Nitrospira sp.]
MNGSNGLHRRASPHLPMVVIGVTYKSNLDALRLARQVLQEKAGERPFLVLVDNSEVSNLESVLSDLDSHQSEIIIHRPGHNLGYFGGAASALQEFLLTHEWPEWVIVCNVDLFLYGESFFVRLMRYGESHTHAVIAPTIISGVSGRDQNPFMSTRPTSLRMNFYKAIFQWYPTLWLYSVMHVMKERSRKLLKPLGTEAMEPGLYVEPVPIYAGHGAFLAFRKSYFESGGSLHHGAFLYGEEVFVAETARRAGSSVAYDPRLRVHHEEHKTIGVWPTRLMASRMKEAAAYCADTFFGTIESI